MQGSKATGTRTRALLLGALLVAAPGARADLPAWLNPASAPFLPVPEIDLDPDSGTTLGVIPTWLKYDSQGDIREIVAPDILHNTYFGWGARGRIYAFPSPDTQWSVVAGGKQRVEREFDAEYQSGLTRGDRWSFSARLVYDRNGTTRFYGIGNDSPEGDQTNYTDEQSMFMTSVGWNITPAWQLGYLLSARVVEILPGTLSGIPSIQQLFPTVPGLGRDHEVLNRLMLRYDTRDDLTVPTRGMELVAYGGLGSRRGFLNDSLYSEAGADARYYLSFSPATVLATHAALRYMPETQHAPFWTLSNLGGDQSVIGGDQPLRGFGAGRFTDRDALSLSAELRQRVASIDAVGTHINVELAPFTDIGRVFSNSDAVLLHHLHSVIGLGLRARAPPFIVGFLDVGYGSEGAAAFTGLNYPF